MFIALFLPFVLSISGRITPITSSSFKKLIEKRLKNEIWIVMFHTDSNFQSKKLYPKFLNASIIAGGMFRFGVIDTKKQSLLARNFNLKRQPSYYVFYQDGQIEYDGSGEAEDIIEFASVYLVNNVLDVDESWLEVKKTPAAILFTNKKNTPILWTGISHVFGNVNRNNKNKVNIGICMNESLFKKFQVKTAPQIVFINKTYKYFYDGKLQFADIERTLNEFLSKSLKVETDDAPDRIMPSVDFASECIGKLKICVLYTKQEEDPSYEEMFRVYNKMQFKWFKGNKEIPFDFIKENEIWIYNPKIEGFLQVDHITSMGPILQKVYNSDVEWKRKYDLMNIKEEL